MQEEKKKYGHVTKLTENPFLNLYQIDAIARDGAHFDYYFASRNDADRIKHKTHSMQPEGMAVYAVTEDGWKIVLVRQYRYPLNDYIYELPAGLIEAGERTEDAAVREMKEETGLTLKVYEGGAACFRRGFFLAQGMSDESGSMVFGTVREENGIQYLENTEDMEVILADRTMVKKILETERITIRCAFLLMQFLKADPKTPFEFLEIE
ncbi:MAG TPA: NUDIX hydrolase [Roseburia sp.]|nr:NUDIX hydrolase [Roseburia sp.]